MRSLLTIATIFFCHSSFALEAFGGPGMTPVWSSAKKTQVGSFFEEIGDSLSPIWFTSSEGVMTELYFPTVDRAQLRDSQILITGEDFFSEERKNTYHEVIVHSPSLATQKNTDPQNRFSISRTLFSLKNEAVVVEKVEITANTDGLNFYLLTNSHLGNTGYFDSAFVENDKSFSFKDEGDLLRVFSSTSFDKQSVGFVGVSDGYQDLKDDRVMDFSFSRALDGNVASTGRWSIPAKKGSYTIWLAYDLGGQHHAKDDYSYELAEYENTWRGYLSGLKKPYGMSAEEWVR